MSNRAGVRIAGIIGTTLLLLVGCAENAESTTTRAKGGGANVINAAGGGTAVGTPGAGGLAPRTQGLQYEGSILIERSVP